MIKSGICVGVGLRGEEGKRNLPNSNVWPIGLDDAIRAGAPVVAIAEGGSDYLRLSQAVEKCGLDTPVIGWPGNVVPEEWESYLLNFDRIIFYRQGDKTSELISKRVRDRLGERVRVVTLPTQVKLTEEIVVSPTNKDICEWCKDMQYWKENYGTTDYDIDERLVKFLRNVPQPRRIVYTLEDMIHPPKTAGWLIENAIPRGEIGLLWGPSQNGKTTLALNLIYSLATGEPLAGIEGLRPASDLPRPLKVLFIEEDASLPNEIIPRLRSIFTGNPSPSDEDFGAVVQRVTAGNVDVRVAQLSLRVDDENSPGYRYATELLEEFWPHVVIYDALRSIHSKEENSPSEMAVVINNLRTLQAYGDNRTSRVRYHV
ncbi:AAA family ATPase [Hydrogenibacillus schlegelii]